MLVSNLSVGIDYPLIVVFIILRKYFFVKFEEYV